MRKIFLIVLASLGLMGCSNDDSNNNSNNNDNDLFNNSTLSINGDWVLYQIKDTAEGTVRSPKDGSGLETEEGLYFLSIDDEGAFSGETLVNEFFGNYSLEEETKLIEMSINSVSEVLEPQAGDGMYYLNNIVGNLSYQLEDGKLYIFIDNEKYFVFKPV